MRTPSNVLGRPLQPCCLDPTTGYGRDGYCRMVQGDLGMHVVCAVMTEDFLEFSFDQGNDLSTPNPDYDFPGLSPGDRWCLCAIRWRDAFQAGVAPLVDLQATHISALEFISLEDLQACSKDRGS